MAMPRQSTFANAPSAACATARPLSAAAPPGAWPRRICSPQMFLPSLIARGGERGVSCQQTRRTILRSPPLRLSLNQRLLPKMKVPRELQALIETHETAIKRSIGLFIERVAAGTTARWQSGMKSKHCWPSVAILRPAEATAGSRPTTC